VFEATARTAASINLAAIALLAIRHCVAIMDYAKRRKSYQKLALRTLSVLTISRAIAEHASPDTRLSTAMNAAERINAKRDSSASLMISGSIYVDEKKIWGKAAPVPRFASKVLFAAVEHVFTLAGTDPRATDIVASATKNVLGATPFAVAEIIDVK